jgi:hypothetical protein
MDFQADLRVAVAGYNETPPSGSPSGSFGVHLELAGVRPAEYSTGEGVEPSPGNFPIRVSVDMATGQFEGEENPWPAKVGFPFDYRKQYRVTIEEVTE